jgi:hypothetical protein
MAGTVFLPDGRDWNASSSVFYWMVDRLAQAASEPLAGALREVSVNNLGCLDLEDLPADQLAELTELVRDLPAVARLELPDTADREVIAGQLAELAGLVSGAE